LFKEELDFSEEDEKKKSPGTRDGTIATAPPATYIMQLPISASRFTLVVFLLVAVTTMMTQGHSSRSGLVEPVAVLEEGQVTYEKRDYGSVPSTAPSYRLVSNPEKDIPKALTSFIVLGISLVFAGLMT